MNSSIQPAFSEHTISQRKQGSKILNKKVTQLASGRARAPRHLSGFAVPLPLNMSCLLQRSKLDVRDQTGHGSALQLTPFWGRAAPGAAFSLSTSCWVQLYSPALDRNLCPGSHGSSPRAEPPGCPPQHPHHIPAWFPSKVNSEPGERGSSCLVEETYDLTSRTL